LEERSDMRLAGPGLDPGAASGSLIGTGFGLVFIEANSGHLPTVAALTVRIGGAVIAVALVMLIAVAGRPLPAGAPEEVRTGFTDRRYLSIVTLEVAALVAGLAVINQVLHRGEAAVAWVALVVGIHFFALAHAWRLPGFHALGAVMTLLGITGFVTDASGGTAALITLVSGIGSGLALPPRLRSESAWARGLSAVTHLAVRWYLP
jgi:hypothetical protein